MANNFEMNSKVVDKVYSGVTFSSKNDLLSLESLADDFDSISVDDYELIQFRIPQQKSFKEYSESASSQTEDHNLQDETETPVPKSDAACQTELVLTGIQRIISSKQVWHTNKSTADIHHPTSLAETATQTDVILADDAFQMMEMSSTSDDLKPKPFLDMWSDLALDLPSSSSHETAIVPTFKAIPETTVIEETSETLDHLAQWLLPIVLVPLILLHFYHN